MDNTKEIFNPLLNYEGIYEVSNFGNIRTLTRPIFRKDGRLHYVQKQKILKKSLFNNGYYFVSLHKNGKTEVRTIHSLVAETFIPNPENKRTINHIDGDKLNNNVENLEWNTDSENQYHALKNSLKKRYSLIAINKETNAEIFFDSVNDAINCGFTQSAISICCANNKKSHKGYYFKYSGSSSKPYKKK
jgi:glycosidase